MKTIFIINPMAGKKNNIEKLVERINSAAVILETDVEIYMTKEDVENFLKSVK